jgi:CHAT domain-containing protein
VVRCGGAFRDAVRHASGRRTSGSEVMVTGPGVSLAPSTGPRVSVSLHGAAADVAGVLGALDGADVAHVAAHGRFRDDNPLLSSLHLADGDLTVYDLEVLRRPPRLVVLAACHSASAQVLPGNQLLGVAHALLALGSAGVVATTLPTPDQETAVLMDALHSGLRAGAEPADALLAARGALDRTTPAGFATSAGFDLYGL